MKFLSENRFNGAPLSNLPPFCVQLSSITVATPAPKYRKGPTKVAHLRAASEAGSTKPSGQFDSVPIRSHVVDENGCNWLNRKRWALNSAVECHPHTSSRFSIFNNLDRLRRTAKPLIVRGGDRLCGYRHGYRTRVIEVGERGRNRINN